MRGTSSRRWSSSARRLSARSATSRPSCSLASRTASRASTAGRSRRRIGGVDLVLYPIFHPAAALYTPAMMTTLEGDFARLPELLSGPAEAPPAPVPVAVGAPPEPVAEPEPEPEYAQLGLF